MAVVEGINLVLLKTELLEPHYIGMSDEVAADELNKVPSWKAGDTRDRTIVPAYEVFEAIDGADWTSSLPTAVHKERVNQLLGMGNVNLKGTNTRAILAAAFGAGTPTRTNILDLQKEPISRAQAIVGLFAPNGSGVVNHWDVARARAS